ncbi:Polyribonucleotide nucleotidyltransferase [Desulfobacca acetoxidans DSM 11109]|uniref:Polyribonucleotide nucleotidyltransferase n=1 Tax=Desulfobacca acetoxidans (strain ATCC 700848 / DSM 11109 / ASRB2) TaxID=880072 RepID=F2NFJ8_DESAR|nr:Polyribonucleotide nucleotidyltransferase [Desulfobacca acetoxidans DSM 11109]
MAQQTEAFTKIMAKTFEVEVGGRILAFEIDKMAAQASGAVFARYGDTGVLVTAVASDRLREGIDFLPLTVDYLEMSYAAGRIPGGFFRREIGRPSEKETLTSRLIDRPIRPLFPKGFFHELQIIATVLSVDMENDPDIIALNGASAALAISDIPFQGPIAAVRMGKVGGELMVNPTISQLKESTLNLIVAGSNDALVMVEGGAELASEEEILEALFTAHAEMQPILRLQEQMRVEAGKTKRPVSEIIIDETLKTRVEELSRALILQAIAQAEKKVRHQAMEDGLQTVLTTLESEYEGREKEITGFYHDLEKTLVRDLVLNQKRRIDGRSYTDIRPISCEVGLLSRTHGSALFSRGETQALAVATLGTVSDEQRIETLTGDTFKAFMLHYNFPPYSVGETRMLRGPSRREIGHGALAERALSRVLPQPEEFPYTIRVVSEILSSNGSSSMATVCGGSLAMMDAGIPIKAPVAGVAMGLIKEENNIAILSDILGDEDHLGDMDFKVAGTAAGITALQMDIKIGGINREIMSQALHQAREARLHILSRMNEAIDQPRTQLKENAPKIVVMTINPDKIREVIGPGGKTVKNIVAVTGAKIDIEDDGRIHIASPDALAANQAIRMIQELTQEPEIGQLYRGKVKKIVDFGAFVEILPGTDGLVHISELDKQRVKKVTDILKEGDEVLVKVLDVDRQGKIRLSRKAALDLDQDSVNP